jgi:hypothetical protein
MYPGFGCVSLTKFTAVKTATNQRNLLAVQKYGQSVARVALSNAQVLKNSKWTMLRLRKDKARENELVSMKRIRN